MEGLHDFPQEHLMRSRDLFHLETMPLVPQQFEVWTSLVGLPLHADLTNAFQSLVAQVLYRLPSSTILRCSS